MKPLRPDWCLITWNNGSWKVFNLYIYEDHMLFEREIDAKEYLNDLFGF